MTTNSIDNTCLNDLSVSSATNGVERKVTVINSTNAANSAATVVASVAGGTAGDAKFQALISGGQTWSAGLDNSDSDAFVLSSNAALGTTNVMHATTAGLINYPLQPSFRAYKSAGSANVTGAGVSYTVPFNTEVWDITNNFNNTDFVAPIAGKYLFTAGIWFYNLQAANSTVQTFINVAGNISAASRVNASANSYGFIGQEVACIVAMAANDHAYVYVQVEDGPQTTGVAGQLYTYFAGHLLS